MAQTLQPTFEGDFSLDRLKLDSGAELRPVLLRYAIYGELNRDRNNAVLVCHALSGSARMADWWSELLGENSPFDVTRDCIICVNLLGSCYGSTGPASTNPESGQPYGPEFPLVSVRDNVRAQAALLDSLGVVKLRATIGGSIGGMQAMEWAIQFPDRVGTCICIAATRCQALALALNHLQRKAIELDPAFRRGRPNIGEGPTAGLSIARGLAMCTYKSSDLFNHRYGRKPNRNGEDPFASGTGRFDVAGYLDYQGEIFNRRFDPNSYISITRTMDTFDFARGFASDAEALRRIKARVLLVGISSDWLFPAADVERLAKQIESAGVDCRYAEIESDHGHDAFLAEPEKLLPLVTTALGATGESPGRSYEPAVHNGSDFKTGQESSPEERERFAFPAEPSPIAPPAD